MADLDLLPLGHDPVRTVDVAADKFLEEVVAAEPGSSLTQLGDPRPHRVGRSADRYSAGCGEVGVRDEVIAGQRLVRLLLGCAPAELPGPRQEDERDRRPSNDDCAYRVATPHLIIFVQDRRLLSSPPWAAEVGSGRVQTALAPGSASRQP